MMPKLENVKKCGWIIVIIAIAVSVCVVLDHFRVGYTELEPELVWHEVEFEKTVAISVEIPEKQFDSPLIVEICIGECCIRNGTSAWHCALSYIKRPTLTQAFCDAGPDTCSTIYKKLIMIDGPYKTYEPLEGFRCVELEGMENENCTRSAISVNGSCQDAIAIYGGVCSG